MAWVVELVGWCIGLIHGHHLGNAFDYVLTLMFCICSPFPPLAICDWESPPNDIGWFPVMPMHVMFLARVIPQLGHWIWSFWSFHY